MTEKKSTSLRAKKLKFLRKAFHLTQKKAAFILDMNFLDYSFFELGKIPVTDKIMVKVARHFRAKLEYLIDDTISMKEFEILLQ